MGRALSHVQESRREGAGAVGRIVLPGPGFAPGRFNNGRTVGQIFTFLGHLAKPGLGQGRLKVQAGSIVSKSVSLFGCSHAQL